MRTITTNQTSQGRSESMLQVRGARLVLATLFALMLSFSSVALAQTTYYVDDDAPAGGDCLSPTSACQAIQPALNISSDGDTISIADGVYSAEIDLIGLGHRSFYGDRSGNTVLRDPGTSPSYSVGIRVGDAGVDVYYLQFEDFNSAISNSYGSPMRIEGCHFSGVSHGITIATGIGGVFTPLTIGRTVITANTFEDLTVSVRLRIGDDVTPVRITDNQFTSGSLHVWAYEASWGAGTSGKLRIGNNTFDGSSHVSVYLDVPNGDARVFNNLFTDGEIGVRSWGGRNLIWNNVFDGMGDDAIDLTDGDGSVIHNTIVNGSEAGIHCHSGQWTDTSYVANNVLLSNDYGLLWESGCQATVETNAAYDNGAGDIVGVSSAYDLGGNLDGVGFSLSTNYAPATYLSPLIDSATDLSATRYDTDYHGVSRGTTPEIGAVEWTAVQRQP